MNRLKQGKTLKDFRKWLKVFWDIQKTWGAKTVYFWSEEEEKSDVIFCEYLVQDIRQWNEKAMLYAASSFIRDLEQIVDTQRITVSRITKSKSQHARTERTADRP